MPTDRIPALDLEHLSFADAVALGRSIRSLGAGESRQDAVARKIVRYLYGAFREPATGQSQCVLVRCFQTQPFHRLPRSYRLSALKQLGGLTPAPDMRCLALLATRGQRRSWDQPGTSIGHQAIPLADVAAIERAPMIERLLVQMGVAVADVVQPSSPGSALVLDAERSSFNVFHVQNALDSPYIPAQKAFVRAFGIQSVVGMGGRLPGGELFAVILFTRAPINRETATLFRTLALSVKLAFLPFAEHEVFSEAV